MAVVLQPDIFVPEVYLWNALAAAQRLTRNVHAFIGANYHDLGKIRVTEVVTMANFAGPDHNAEDPEMTGRVTSLIETWALFARVRAIALVVDRDKIGLLSTNGYQLRHLLTEALLEAQRLADGLRLSIIGGEYRCCSLQSPLFTTVWAPQPVDHLVEGHPDAPARIVW